MRSCKSSVCEGDWTTEGTGDELSQVNSGARHLVSERKQGWDKDQEESSPFPSVPDASCRCRIDLERVELISTDPVQCTGVFCWGREGLGGAGRQVPSQVSVQGLSGWGVRFRSHQTTGKRMAPQQMRSTRNKISFQSP